MSYNTNIECRILQKYKSVNYANIKYFRKKNTISYKEI